MASSQFPLQVAAGGAAATTTAMATVEGIEVVREIGRGNYGSVWLVRQPGSCRNLVLKCVSVRQEEVREEKGGLDVRTYKLGGRECLGYWGL